MTESKEIQWRKTGGGSLRYIRGKIIKPNEIFTAKPEEISTAFRKHVVPLEDVPVAPPLVPVKSFTVRRKEPSKAEEIVEGYQAQKRSTGSWWDVINIVSGKAINEKGLREAAAKQLAEELNA